MSATSRAATTDTNAGVRQHSEHKREPVITPTPTPNIHTDSDGYADTRPTQNLAELQSQIRKSLARPELQRGQVGVKIVSLDSGKTLFENNAEKYFMPASNMKSFTVATALEKLSPNFQFVTNVYAPMMPDANGVIRGDLTIFGRGDVSFSTAFNDGDYYKGLDALAEKIVAGGRQTDRRKYGRRRKLFYG